MGLFSRMKAQLSLLLAPAEDPEQAAAGAAMQEVELLRRLRVAIDAVVASRARLEAQAERLRGSAAGFEADARQALRQGRDDLARAALLRKRATSAQLTHLNREVECLRVDEGRLRLEQQRLSAQIEAVRARQEVVSARYTAAEAQVRINEALAGVADGLADLQGHLAETEEETDEMQARASAIEELMRDGVLTSSARLVDALPGEVLSKEEAALLERELLALKADVDQIDAEANAAAGGAASAASLGGGRGEGGV